MKKIIYFAILSCVLFSCKKKEEYNATGIFEATTVTISAETAGNIVSMSLIEGDSVTLGQNVAMIDTTMFAIQIKQLQSQRKSAESSMPDISAQAAALRSQISHQQQECERFGRLLEDGATTQKTYDDAVAYLNMLKGQLEALLSTLNNSKKTISDNSEAIAYQTDQIREQIDKCHIISPLYGTILTKYAEPGEYATPGKPLYKIADLDNIYLRCYFTASQLADIKIGQRVTVIADFGGDEQYEYPGTVTWIAEESEFTPKSIQTNDSRANLVYAAKVAVRNDGRLKIGQYGEVRL
ncbi:MAG: HlyD family efflux transporter periplasmic adaptor subunit [Paramuribaculum sp.]|nr:HlyD family efflux transporter periplasmic adaptor subunit [Paramuribaculum sp.]